MTAPALPAATSDQPGPPFRPRRAISADVARLFLVRRQFLAPPRSLPAGPDGVLDVIARVGSLQFDPLDIAGRNHDLVLLARVRGYRREWTDALLYEDRRLFEAYNKGLSLLPTDELPWYRLTWERWREQHEADTFPRHKLLVEELLGRIRAEGPLSSIDFEARGVIDWFWRPTNQVRAMLEALAQSGILGLAGRRGNRRLYDLVERLFPADLLARREDPLAQRRHRLLSRFRAHGMLGRTGSAELWLGAAPAIRKDGYDGPTRGDLLEDLVARGDLVTVNVDGLKGDRFIVGAELELLDRTASDIAARAAPGNRSDAAAWHPLDPAAAGVAFLAPLDPFVWDREFLRRLYDFDYRWEVYVPEAKRTWGYYVLPVLWGERLVGRIEPRIDRRAGELRIIGAWWEPWFDPLAQPGFVPALAEALDAHRAFGDVGRIVVAPRRGRMSSPRAIREAIRLLPAAARQRRPPASRGTIRRR